MTQQIINVGTADKGNGDPLRTAFVKINSNFNELYASLGADFENLETSLIPSQDDTYNLGSTTKRWRSLYLGANTLYLDNIPLTVEGGILKVNGVSINGGDLGKLKIQDGFIGTVDNPDTGGWGDYGLTLDPGGESQAFISLPSVPAQGEGAALIIQNKGDSTSIVQVFGRGGVQVVTNTGEAEEVFEFGDDGKLRLPMGGDILNANGDSVLGIQGLTVDQAASRTNIGKSVTESVNTVTSRLFVLPNQVGLESISDPAGPNNSSTGLVVVGNSAIELSLVEQSIGGDAVVALAINGTGVEIAQGDGVTTEYLSINTSGLTFPISANVSAVGLGLRGDVTESYAYLNLPSDANANTNHVQLGNDNGNVKISAMSQGVGVGRIWTFNTNGTLVFPDGSTALTTAVLGNGLDADLKGSVFADDSSIMVNAIDNTLQAYSLNLAGAISAPNITLSSIAEPTGNGQDRSNEFVVNLKSRINPAQQVQDVQFKITTEKMVLPFGNGYIEVGSGLWALDSANKNLQFPNNDGIRYDTVGGYGLELWTYLAASPIAISPGQSTTWTFDNNGSITFPDTTVQTTALRTSQSESSVAIGGSGSNRAGDGLSAQGEQAVAIGFRAARSNQGSQAIAIGSHAGDNDQGIGSISLGTFAGYVTQGTNAIAIGTYAGQTNQGAGGIAIGRFAGFTGQAIRSIAIGDSAGKTNQQGGTIVLNATGNPTNTTEENSFYVNPIRSATSTGNILHYNTSTKEVGYSSSLTFPDSTTQTTAWTKGAAAVQSSAPSSPVTGQLWYDTDDGNTYVWTGSAWVDSNPAVAAATVDIMNTNGIDTNYFITFVETRDSGQYLRADVDLFFNSWSNTLTAGNVTTGVLKIDDGAHEKFQAKADATGTVTHDCASGHVFYHTSPDANWTANFTNLNLDSGYATAVTLIIVQGGTGYYPSAVQIGGVGQTLNWQANTTPTPSTNRTDVVTFSIINNSGTYIVLGQLTGF